jgi:hypothetical protein
MDKLSDDEVAKFSEYIAENEIKDFVLLMNQEYTLRAFLRTIESWLRATGFVYRREAILESPNMRVFVINHSMGRRWSLYFKKLLKYCLNDLGHKSAAFDVTDSSIAFKIDISD